MLLPCGNPQDGTEVECVSPFSLIHPHKCVSGKREICSVLWKRITSSGGQCDGGGGTDEGTASHEGEIAGGTHRQGAVVDFT